MSVPSSYPLSRRKDGIPLVVSTAQRNSLYPTPDVDQRVENLETGAFERWTGTAWVQDITGGSGGTGTANLFAINATFDGTNWRAIATGPCWVIWQAVDGNLQIGASGGTITANATFIPAPGMEITPAGVVSAQTPGGTDNSTTVATTAFVQNLVSAGGAPINSPTFTGNPQAPTPSPGNNSTSLATTAFVTTAVAAGTGAISSVFTRTGAIVATSGDYTVSQVTGAAPTASPTFTGTPAAPTPGSNVNTTQLVTGAWVNTYFALSASPTFTGVPVAPTASSGTNTTQLATTAFVQLGSFVGNVTINSAKAGAASFTIQSSVAGTTDDFSIVNNDNGSISMKLGGTTKANLSGAAFNIPSGSVYQINGTKVLGPVIGGYGTPTNVSKTSSLPGTSATLSQVGGTLAALIADLTTQGIIN